MCIIRNTIDVSCKYIFGWQNEKKYITPMYREHAKNITNITG